ncbi:MAG: NADH-quinone oxidoreductase subunit K [Bacteroidota bacterium]
MEVILALSIGVLYSGGIYLLLRRSLVKFILGIIMLGNATNMIIFISSGLTEGRPAFIEAGAYAADPGVSDPLPQALILTAIVIGFAIVAFTLILKYKFYKATGTYDIDQLVETDKVE